MNRKLNYNYIAALTGFCALFGTQNQISAKPRPNFLILFVDDLGWADLGYRNPEFHTPNIDKLSVEGVDFTRAYVSTATSSPSRASLLTGKEALRCGFVRHIYGTFGDSEFESFDRDPAHMLSRAWLPLEEVTYAEKLHNLGYYNCHVGKWHLGPEKFFPVLQGFDEMRGTCNSGHPDSYYFPFFKTSSPFPNSGAGDYLTESVTNQAIDFIKNYDGDSPFLLNVWYYAVHSPHIGRVDLVEKYLSQGYEKKRAEYLAMIETLDESVGQIRRALRETGIDKNTVIIFASDQGGAFRNGHLRGGKMGGDTLGEGGSRIPMIIYLPQITSNLDDYERPVQTIDVFPTLMELASGTKYEDNDINGVSLVPVLEGRDIKTRDLFLHRSYEDQNCAIIRGNWKLISYRSGKKQLYNLRTDDGETTNLIKLYPKLADSLALALERWRAEATPEYLLSR